MMLITDLSAALNAAADVAAMPAVILAEWAALIEVREKDV